MFAYQKYHLKNSLPQGSILIEMMLTITLNVLLLACLLEIYTANHRAAQIQNALYELQDIASDSIHVLSSAIKQAGDVGCPKLVKDLPVYGFKGVSISPENKLIGNEQQFTVKYAAYPRASLPEDMQETSRIIIPESPISHIGEVMVISDCTQVEFFKIEKISKAANKQIIYPTQPLRKKYSHASEVGRWVDRQFFVADTKYKNQRGKIIKALFMRDNDNKIYEIVTGVTQMVLHYQFLENENWIERSDVSDATFLRGVSVALQIQTANLKETRFAEVALS